MKLKFHESLKHFSAVAVVVRLWEQNEIKKEIRKYFDNWQSRVNTIPRNAQWLAVVKKVSDHANMLCLPENVLNLVQNLITPIGEKIFYWIMYLLYNLGLEYQYTEKIYWTPLGTIDEKMCFQNHWLKVAEKGRETPKLFTSGYNPQIFYLACLFNQKDFLRAHFQELRTETQSFLLPYKIINNKSKLHTIIIIWLCVHFAQGKTEAVELYNTFGKSEYMCTDKEFFLMSVQAGLFEAMIYFWSKLNKSEKQDVIKKAAEKAMKYTQDDHSEDKCIEILIFLMNNMAAKERKDFCNENFVALFRVFMSAWPYQEMAEKIYMKYEYDDDRLMRENEYVMDYCLRRIIDSDKSARYVDKDLCVRMFRREYDGTIGYFKTPTFIDNDYYLLKLYQCFDIPVLSIILNDPMLKTFRQKMLDMGNPKFKQFVRSKDFDLLNKFTQSVFKKSETQKKKFKLSISLLPELLSEGNYELADEILNWLANGSVEEKIVIKKEINTKKVCSLFKNFKCELIDKLLSWQYDTEEERKNAKGAMKENEFICDKIVKIWNENIKDGENKCMVFLRWLSGTEEEAIELKNRLIIDESFVRKFCKTLPSWKRFRRIEELFEFVSLPPPKILEIKTKIIKNSNAWINFLVVNQKNFKVAEALVDWIFVDYGQKKEVIKGYINSIKGADLLRKIFLGCKTDQVQPLSFILNSWVRLYGNIDQIKENLLHIDLDDWDELHAVSKLNTLLDMVKTGEKIIEHHINKLLPDRHDLD